MSYNSSTGMITAPVSISDVQSALAINANDLATLCKYNYINQWSLRKPLITNNVNSSTKTLYINMETLNNRRTTTSASTNFYPVIYFSNCTTFLNLIIDCEPIVKYKNGNNKIDWSNHPENLNLYSRWYLYARNKSNTGNYYPMFWKKHSNLNDFLNGYRLSDFNGYYKNELTYSWVNIGFDATTKNSTRDETVQTTVLTQSSIENLDSTSINGWSIIGEMRKCFGGNYGIRFYLKSFVTDTFGTLTDSSKKIKRILYQMYKDQGTTDIYMCIDVINLSAGVMYNNNVPVFTGTDMWKVNNFFDDDCFILNPYTAYSPSYDDPWSGGSNNDYGGTRHYSQRVVKYIGSLDNNNSSINIPNNSDFMDYNGDIFTKDYIKWSDLLPSFITGDNWNNITQVSNYQYDEYFEICIGFYCTSGTASIDNASRTFGNKPYHMMLPCRGNRIIVYIGKNQS